MIWESNFVRNWGVLCQLPQALGKGIPSAGSEGSGSSNKTGEIRIAMIQFVIRFLIGGAVVSAFAVTGDLLKPKSFAGLFGAAPSVALATLGLTIAKDGPEYARMESRSMMAGAIALFAYASIVSWIMMRFKLKAMLVTIYAMPIWIGVAFGLWLR